MNALIQLLAWLLVFAVLAIVTMIVILSLNIIIGTLVPFWPAFFIVFALYVVVRFARVD